MAEGKKSFVAYCDWIDTFEALPDDKAGQLAKHLFRYVNDLEPESDDILINAVFANIKQTLKRDLKKYDTIKLKRSESGKLGGRPKNQTKAKKANALLENQTKAKKAVSDSVSVSDSVINIEFSDFWELYDKKRGDKEAIEKKWNKLSNKDRQNIIDYIPKYKISQPDKQYRKDPSTFLNNKSWNDELIGGSSLIEDEDTPSHLKGMVF